MSELAAPSFPQGRVEMVLTTADGRVFNLGKPTSLLFPLRVRIYKFKRRKEF